MLGRGSKFWLEPEIELAYNYNLKRSQLRDIEAIIEDHARKIVDAWRRHFNS